MILGDNKARNFGATISLFFLGMLCLFPIHPTPQATPINLPNEFTNYRSWRKMLKEPRRISMQLATDCMYLTDAQWAVERKKDGPHADRYIMVYGNPLAYTGQTGKIKSFPVGTILVKEKFRQGAIDVPDGIAFMVKRAEPEYKKTGGWQFMFFPSPENPRKIQKHCASCHGNVAAKDYVFGEYPP